MLSKTGPAAFTVIVFNLLPVLGVAFYHWSPFEMFWLFWMETLIIAVFNSIRVLFSQGLPPGRPVGPVKLQYQVGSAAKYLVVRFLIFLFYSVFIIVFIGFLAGEKNPVRLVQTLALRNLLFNLALALSAFTQGYYLLRYFFANKAYLFTKPSDFPAVFDGRQIVIHIAVVVGAVGAAFLFRDEGQQGYASLWVISIFCLAKCFFELYSLGRQRAEMLQGTAAY